MIASQSSEHKLTDSSIFENVFRQHDAIMFLIDSETGQIIDVNDAAIKFYGYSKNLFIRMTICELNDLPSDIIATEILDVVNGKHKLFTRSHRLASGEIRYVEVHASTIVLNEKKCLFSIVQDITARTQVENELRHVSRLYAVHSAINHCIVRIRDPDELFCAICQVAIDSGKFRMSWVGLIDENTKRVKPVATSGKVEGYLDNINITTEDSPSGRGPVGSAIQEGRVCVSYDIATDPKMLPWRNEALKRGYRSAAAVPFCRKGKPVGVFAIYASEPGFFVDSELSLLQQIGDEFSFAIDAISAETEKKRMEEELQKSQKLESLGVLAGGIAHDFNNLLGGIYGFIDMANAIADEDKLKLYLSRSMATIDRARDLSRQLITFAKGGTPIRSVGQLFPCVRETVQFALSGSNVSCTFEIQSDLWLCDFDKNQIGQVIDNIVINAKQAMPGGGTIEIFARNVTLSNNQYPMLKAGNYIEIAIRDYGLGMTMDIQKRVFDPFFTTKATGHGLGLSTCYSIVKRHNGAIHVESELGKGSTFHVFLPAATGQIDECKVNGSQTFKGKGTFVVMDDEEVIREVISSMLESLDYSVVCCKNGNEAVDFFKAESIVNCQIAGAVLDLTIPGGMGGKEAVHKLKEISPQTIFIAASGHSEDPIMSNPQEFGFTASISKPFRKSEFTELISKEMKM